MRRGHPDPHATAPGGPGPAARGLLDPHDYHYRRLITDAVRAVDAVRALPGVDASRVAVAGNSQGGGVALAVAGLVPDLAAVLVTAPFLCGIRRALDLTDASPYGEISAYLSVHRGAEEAVHHTLSYVEGISFARRAQAPAHFGVGLRDTVCPPSGRTRRTTGTRNWRAARRRRSCTPTRSTGMRAGTRCMCGGNWDGCGRCWGRECTRSGEGARAAEQQAAQFGAGQRVGAGGGDGAHGQGEAGRRQGGEDADENDEQGPVALAPGRPRAGAVAR